MLFCFVALGVVVFNYRKSHRRTAADFITLGKSHEQYKSVDDFFVTRKIDIEDRDWITFRFLNNPYNLDDKNTVLIYVNYKLVYAGPYKYLVGLKGNPDSLFSKKQSMIISMVILTDKTKKVVWAHNFATKEVFSWEEDYKVIYCVFTPTNENVERVYFIPHREELF